MTPSRPSTSSTITDDDIPLPFPTALPRESFLAADFHAPTYLSTLAGRHQTLEDLRSELRERSALISAEMHALVNTNWAEFLSLGVGLRGGEEKMEGVRVAVLGLKRGLEETRAGVKARRDETARLCGELGDICSAKETARSMMQLADGVVQLESRLGTSSSGGGYYTDTDSDPEDRKDEYEEGRWIGVSSDKLKDVALDLVRLEDIAEKIGKHVPLVKSMCQRIDACRESLLLDVWTGLKEARQAAGGGKARLMDYLKIYNILGAQADAVDKLRE